MNFQEIIKSQNEKIQFLETALILSEKRCEQYSEAYDRMQEQLRELIRNRFGKKSERFIDPENRQLSLFSEDNLKFTAADAAGNQINDEIKIPAHTRKKKQKAGKDIPVRIEIIPVSDAEKQCTCGACKVVIRYETKELIHHQPVVLKLSNSVVKLWLAQKDVMEKSQQRQHLYISCQKLKPQKNFYLS